MTRIDPTEAAVRMYAAAHSIPPEDVTLYEAGIGRVGDLAVRLISEPHQPHEAHQVARTIYAAAHQARLEDITDHDLGLDSVRDLVESLLAAARAETPDPPTPTTGASA